MAIPYQTYYNQAMSRYAPARERDIGESSAALADKGLLASTGGQGALADIRAKYNAMAQEAANAQGQWQAGHDLNQQQFAEQKAQNARQTAQNWYDMVNSNNLAKWQISGKAPANNVWMNTPSWLRSYQTNNRLRYGDGKGEVYRDECIGDGKGAVTPSWVNYEAHAEDLGDTLQSRTADRNYDLDKARLALAQRQYADAKKEAEQGDDPWKLIAETAFQNATTDIDPAQKGFQAGAFPSALLSGFKAMYGIDVAEAAQTENPHQAQALAVMKLLYPKTWIQRVDAGGTSWPEWLNSRGVNKPAATPSRVVTQYGDDYTPNTEGTWAYGYDEVPSSTYASSNMKGYPLVNPNPFRR